MKLEQGSERYLTVVTDSILDLCHIFVRDPLVKVNDIACKAGLSKSHLHASKILTWIFHIASYCRVAAEEERGAPWERPQWHACGINSSICTKELRI